MALQLKQTATAVICGGAPVAFGATGGVEPYVYSIENGGGAIDPDTGMYTSEDVMPEDPTQCLVTIKVVDADAAEDTATLLVTDALGLVCDILRSEMGLEDGRVYLWDQKLFGPTDNGLFIAVTALSPKPFANNITYVDSGSQMNAIQSVNMKCTLQIDIMSRGPAARARKEEVVMALMSTYSQQQQTANSFYIAPITTNFVNLSEVDGAAIPYRYSLSVNIQYFVKKIKRNIPFFDTFADPTVVVEP